MEAMVVIAIMAITAGLAAPAIGRTMADRRAVEATQGLVRIGAQARSEAMVFGRAHLLRYAQVSGGPSATDGRVELWRGSVDRCAANDWATLLGADCAASPRCIALHDMGAYDFPTHRVRMRMDGAAAGNLCFEPNGEMYVQTTGGFEGVPPAGSEAVRFTFTRLESGSPAGVVRAVIFPFGTTPRLER